MRFIYIFAIFALISGCVDGTAAVSKNKQYHLSRQQLAMVQNGVGRATGLPNLLVVSRVAAAIDANQTIVVCGAISLGEADTRRSAFIGMFGPTSFDVIYIGRDWATQAAVHSQCDKSGASIREDGANASKAKSAEVSTLLEQYEEADQRCRGTEGARNPAVCGERDRVALRLNRLESCYGKAGEVGHQNTWHLCGPDSVRIRS